jgi:hypothetical protein
MASRINFKTIIAKYSKLGKSNVRLTQSSLYLTKPIQPTTTVYNFDVLETQASTLQNNEIRLNLNDEFIIAGMSMGLECSILNAEGGDTGSKFLLTYAPFEQASVEASKIANFYAGALQISVNNIVYLDKYDTRRSQITPTTNFSNFVAGTGGSTQPSVDWSNMSFYNNEPLLTLSGSKKNTITISLPTAISVATFPVIDNGGKTYSVKADRVFFFVRGLNAQNGSVFQG